MKIGATPTTKEHVRPSLVDLLDKFSYFTTTKELKDEIRVKLLKAGKDSKISKSKKRHTWKLRKH